MGGSVTGSSVTGGGTTGGFDGGAQLNSYTTEKHLSGKDAYLAFMNSF